MTNQRKQQYDLYLNIASMGIIKAAQAVLLESAGQLVQMAFKYTAEYLCHEQAFALDPIQLPLTTKEINLHCAGGMPGILDDYLPDDWGRKVITRLAYYQGRGVINQNSAIDVLALLSESRIGALQWVKVGESPHYELGCEIKNLIAAETAAHSIDQPHYDMKNVDEMSLLYLASAGSGVGGARPKALLYKGRSAYLAKFNRIQSDAYNNATIELACLEMAKAAGLNVLGGEVRSGINGRDVLLLDRFDVIHHDNGTSSRRHLLTINALLKNTETQRDKGGVFLYGDIAQILKKLSIDIDEDLMQLLRLMLFNRAINNTDDHERNFSLMSEGKGYRLAYGYDLVPSLVRGAYPVAGYKQNPRPPRLSEVKQYGKIFGLPKTKVTEVVDQMIPSLENWTQWAEKNNVSDDDRHNVKQVIQY